MVKLVNTSNRGDVERKLSSSVKNTLVKPYKAPKKGQDSDANSENEGGGGGGGLFDENNEKNEDKEEDDE